MDLDYHVAISLLTIISVGSGFEISTAKIRVSWTLHNQWGTLSGVGPTYGFILDEIQGIGDLWINGGL